MTNYISRLVGRSGVLAWRLDVACLGLLLLLGAVMRTSLFNSGSGALLVTVIVDPAMLLLVLLLRPVLLRKRLAPSFAPTALIGNAVLCVVAALVMTLWAKFVTGLTGWRVPSWGPVQSWVVPFGYYLLVFASWTAAHHWLMAEEAAQNEKRRAAVAEGEALRAELQHLRHQLDPHFVFNALNGIATEIHDDPNAAIGMVHQLAEYLRYSLAQRNRTVTPFAEEIGAVRSYLDVQKARFGDDLSYRLSVDDASLAKVTPSFLLQPLVENAVKHGFNAGHVPLDIVVEATADEDAMKIKVSSDGILREDWRSAGDPGIGLSVLRRRLDLHYPGRYRFEMLGADRRVVAELQLWGDACFA